MFNIRLAVKKIKVIPLRQAKVSSERDNKDKNVIIKIDIPSDPSLLLKALNQNEFSIWYNSIKLRILNLIADDSMKYFDRALERLEYVITRIDKKEVASLFESIETAMKTEERRTAMFEDFERYNRKYKYLEDLYNNIKAYETMCKLGKLNNALSCANVVYKMITEFEFKDLDKDNSDLELEVQVRDMLRKLADSKLLQNLSHQLKELENKCLEGKEGLFIELTNNLYKKIKEVRTKLRNNKDVLVENQEFKMLSLPMSFYKKACQWTMPTLLNPLVGRSEDNISPRKPPSPTKNYRALRSGEMSTVVEQVSVSRNLNINQIHSYYAENAGVLDL